MDRLTFTTVPAQNVIKVHVRYQAGWFDISIARDVPRLVGDEDVADIYWYFEERRLRPEDQRRAHRVSRQMQQIGESLFIRLFGADDDSDRKAKRLRKRLRNRLSSTEIVVHDGVSFGRLPWELLRDPVSGRPLALDALSFSHVLRSEQAAAKVPLAPRPIRLLLVISRPARQRDIPFLNVARRLLARSHLFGGPLDLTVIRPATYAEFSRVLRIAHDNGAPYDAVHFDGHGLHDDRGPDPSGVLIFDDPSSRGNEQYIDGQQIGTLLADTGVQLLTMNACRSASPISRADDIGGLTGSSVAVQIASRWPISVVAMAYDVFEDAAGRFVDALYEALGRGLELGKAASLARRAVADNTASLEGIPQMEWAAPVVFSSASLRVSVTDRPSAGSINAAAYRQLPVLFVGRDDVILDLEQNYAEASAVVLHGAAGTGKTLISSVFASWYMATGGADATVTVDFRLDPDIRELASRLPRHKRVLWVWENVDAELTQPSSVNHLDHKARDMQQVLAEVLVHNIKVLVTSRNADPLPGFSGTRKVGIGPLSDEDAVRLAAWWARHFDLTNFNIRHALPLIRYATGLPLAIKAGIETLARNPDRSDNAISETLNELLSGRVVPTESTGKMEQLVRDLAAAVESLDIPQRRLSALLHLFRIGVFVPALPYLQECENLAVDQKSIEAMCVELDQLVACGLLIPWIRPALFFIHPAALPVLKSEFLRWIAPTNNGQGRAKLCYAESINVIGEVASKQYASDPDLAIAFGIIMESNFWHAREIVRDEGRLDMLPGIVLGLRNVLRSQGRVNEWAEVVNELSTTYIHPRTGSSREGLEDAWALATQCVIELARDTGDEKTARFLVERALPTFKRLAEIGLKALHAGTDSLSLSKRERYNLRSYGTAVLEYVAVRTDLPRKVVDAYLREASNIGTALGDESMAAAAAGNLVNSLTNQRRFAEAEEIAREALANFSSSTYRSHLLLALGNTLYVRRQAALEQEDEPSGDRSTHPLPTIGEIIKYLGRALVAAPITQPAELAAAHLALANIFDDLKRVELALGHYGESLKLYHQAGDELSAAIVADNMSMSYDRKGQTRNARHYALQAINIYQRYPHRVGHLIPAILWRIDRLGATELG